MSRRGIFSLAKMDSSDSSSWDSAFFFQSEGQRIAELARKAGEVEIGGDLFGYYSAEGRPIVLVATHPGPNSHGTATNFYQDGEYQSWCFRSVAQRYRLFYLGDWHSHHRLTLSEPSGSDDSKLADLAQKNSWGRLMSIIIQTGRQAERKGARDDVIDALGVRWNAFAYDFGNGGSRRRVGVEILGEASPLEGVADQLLRQFESAVSARGIDPRPPVEGQAAPLVRRRRGRSQALWTRSRGQDASRSGAQTPRSGESVPIAAAQKLCGTVAEMYPDVEIELRAIDLDGYEIKVSRNAPPRDVVARFTAGKPHHIDSVAVRDLQRCFQVSQLQGSEIDAPSLTLTMSVLSYLLDAERPDAVGVRLLAQEALHDPPNAAPEPEE